MQWPQEHFIHLRHKSSTAELIGVLLSHNLLLLHLQLLSYSQTWCHLDLHPSVMHPRLKFGSKWEADLIAGILFNQGMDIMCVGLWISVAQAKRPDIFQDIADIPQDMERGTTPRNHSPHCPLYTHRSQDTLRHPDEETFLVTLDVFYFLLIIPLIARNETPRHQPLQGCTENLKFLPRFSCLHSDIKAQCQRW